MIIKTLSGFGVNGRIYGGLTAVDDDGQTPLGWEGYGNWSDGRFFDREIKRLSTNLGVTEDRARSLLTQAIIQAPAIVGIPDASQATQSPDHTRPRIMTSGRYKRDIIDESWALLQISGGADPAYFRMGNTLVRIEDGYNGMQPVPMRMESLAAALDRLGDYVRVTKEGDETPAHPDRTVTAEMLACLPDSLPTLNGLKRVPFMDRQGNCLTNSGYYPDLGVYFNAGGLDIPPVPVRPTSTHIDEAKRLLMVELLGDFPFTSPADLANTLTVLLEQVLGPNIDGPKPLHMVEAPDGGTGKGLLVRVLSLIINGKETLTTPPSSESDWKKLITSTLLKLPDIFVIDNVERPLDSPALMAALTTTYWEDRELGYSRNIGIPVHCTWIATGNNPRLLAEMPRRTVRTRIDAGVSLPGERTGPDPNNPSRGWRHLDLAAWTRDHRADLLWAALVLARAWHVAGRPVSTETMGSYESWAKVMGGVLDVAGVTGFLANRDQTYGDALVDDPWMPMVSAWAEAYGEQITAIDKLYALAREKQLLPELRSGRADQGARVKMGRELSRRRDRRVGDWFIRNAGLTDGGSRAWRLEKPSSQKMFFGEWQISPESPVSPVMSTNFTGDTGEELQGNAQSPVIPGDIPGEPLNVAPRSVTGDTGDSGDILNSSRGKNICDLCNRSVPVEEIDIYTDTGVICGQCGPN